MADVKSVISRIFDVKCRAFLTSKDYFLMAAKNGPKGQPGNVVNPARGHLNKENEYFPVPVLAREFGLSRRFRQSRPASVCSSAESPYVGIVL